MLAQVARSAANVFAPKFSPDISIGMPGGYGITAFAAVRPASSLEGTSSTSPATSRS